MNRRFHLFALTCLSTFIVGCGDTPHVQLRDAVTTWNEVCDLVHTIPDDPDTAEKFAEELYKGPLDELKKKWDDLKKRMEKLQKLDKEQKVGLEDAIADLRDEARFSIARLAATIGAENDPADGGKRSMGHLGKLRDKLVKELAKRGTRKGPIDPDKEFPSFKKISDLLSHFSLELPQTSKNAAKYGVWWNYNRYQAPKLPPPPVKDKGGEGGGQNPGGNPPMP